MNAPRKSHRRLFLAWAVAILALLMSPATGYADSYVVNTADDHDDGQCSSEDCSLREAITAANEHAGSDQIAFDLQGQGPFGITVYSPLPALLDGGTVIDGTTQPAYAGTPLISLKRLYPGLSTTEFTGGITIASSGNVVRGLGIRENILSPGAGSCKSFGAGWAGVVVLSGSGNIIEGNTLGSSPGGGSPGNLVGVYIHPNAPGQIIRNNVISGNICGLLIEGDGQTIQDNLIGTDPSGTTQWSNKLGGIIVASYGNLIGGQGHGNLISGNTNNGQPFSIGIYLYTEIGVPSGNVIQGNMIGTDISGTNPIPNDRGIYYIDGDGSMIGGENPGEGNLVAFNHLYGIKVEGNDHHVVGNESHDNGLYGVKINQHSVISKNSIYDNGDLGIYDALGNATPPPILLNASGFTIFGSACPGCTVEVFLAAPDPTGAGEGKDFLGSVSTEPNGEFFLDLPDKLPYCTTLTATATDGREQTSRFSDNLISKPCWFLGGLRLPILVAMFPLLIGPAAAVLLGRRRGRSPGRSLLRGVLFGALGGAGVGAVLFLLPFVRFQMPVAPVHPPEPGLDEDETMPYALLLEPTGEASDSDEPSDPSLTPTVTATVTETPTPTQDAGECTYQAVVNLFCREGPSSKFKAIDSFTPGQTAPIIGQGSEGLYWYVLGPISSLVCTVPQGDQYGVVTGDCSTVPRFTPMPTPVDTPTPSPTPTPTPTSAAFGG